MNVTVLLARQEHSVKEVSLDTATACGSISNTYFKFNKYFCIISDEALSDVAFSGTRSYLSLPPVELHLQHSLIDIEVRPLCDRGLLMFVGHQDGNSFLSLSLQGGVLELRLASGTK
jgi:hypothetical protein